jgi:hypothetical protein
MNAKYQMPNTKCSGFNLNVRGFVQLSTTGSWSLKFVNRADGGEL